MSFKPKKDAVSKKKNRAPETTRSDSAPETKDFPTYDHIKQGAFEIYRSQGVTDGHDADLKTLILVCRQAFSRIVERMLRSEGFTNFQRGGLSLTGGTTFAAREGASEVFVLRTDVGSARRLADILRACPIRGRTTGLFELYTLGN